MTRTALAVSAGAALVAACTVVACTTATTKPRKASVVVDRGPYLQATTRHEATVCWRTTTPAPTVVHVAGEDDVAATTVLETEHAFTLSNLAEATHYTYRVEGDATDHVLTTAPGPDASFRAIAIGDSGEGTPEQMELAKRIEEETFDVFLHTGDVVYPDGGEKDYDARFFLQYGALLATHPFFPTIGNHDMHPPDRGAPYERIFRFEPNNPEHSRRYYSFSWGCAKFVMIESYKLFQEPGPHQEWLEKELASNDRRWLVLVMHVAPYSPGPHGDNAALIARLVPLIAKHKVSLVLAGHDHVYERGEPPGWQYIVTGGGGASLYPVKTPHSWTAHAESSFHFVKLDFTKTRISGEMIRRDGSRGDAFSF